MKVQERKKFCSVLYVWLFGGDIKRQFYRR